MFPSRLLRRVLALTLAALPLFLMRPAHSVPPPDMAAVSGSAQVAGLSLAPEARPASEAVLHLSFALHSARLSGVDAFLASQRDPKSLNYHHALTPQQFGERFGASDADIAAVADWARARGMTVTHVWPSKLFVSADSTVSNAEAAFGVQIRGYRRAEGDTLTGTATFYGPNLAPLLPKDVAGRVDALFGLDDFLAARPAFRIAGGANKVLNAMVPRAPAAPQSPAAAKPAPGIGSGRALPVHPPTLGSAAPSFSSEMTPDQVSTFYEFDPLHNVQGFHGGGQTIAVFSPTGYDLNDLAYFANAYGRTGYTVNVVNVDGGNSNLANQLEPALDTDVIIGQARYATINLYEEPNNGTGFIDGFNQIASDNPPVLSISWAYDEGYLHSNHFDSFVNTQHATFNQMASQGMAVYASTGDNGAVVGTDGTNISFPASDPNITAVGGTDNLVDSSSSYVSEQGWTGSGGGLSVYFGRPGYQAGPGVINGYSNGNRQLPDISADGGPTPGYSVRAGGNWYHAWGTSASAPLWATANVLINQGTASLGFGSRSFGLNPFLYDIGTNLNGYDNAEVFHDSTSGNNGYPTTGKWDFVTGWGSARFAKLYYDDVYRPDFVPFTPGGWSSPILISSSNASAAEPSDYYDNLTTYYTGYAFINNGPADGRNETSRLVVDGGANNDIYNADLPVNYYFGRFPITGGTLSLGPHTFTMTADVNNDVAENNEGNNSYTRTITVRPYNDNFNRAQYVGVGSNGSNGGNNSYATKESGEPNHGFRAGASSIWYEWYCPASGYYTFNTAGSSFDTLLGVYRGSAVGSLTMLGENDDFNGTVQSSVTFYGTGGVFYFAAVDGYNGATGTVSLAWSPASSVAAPTVSSLSPSTAQAGTAAFTLTVYGANFVNNSVVNWNGSARPTTFVSAGQLNAAISASDLAAAGNVPVTVSTFNVGTSAALTFTVSPGANTPPTVSSLSPSSTPAGGMGFTLTVNGANFVPSSIVKWNGGSRTTTYVSATKLTATISATDIASAGTVPISVTTPHVGTSGTINFTITPAVGGPPTITSLSPTAKAAGATTFTLTVNGTNFVASSIVKWNGGSRTTTYVSATKLTATINTSDLVNASTFPITVTTPHVGTSAAVNFSVQALTLGVGTMTRGGAGITVPITLKNTTPATLSSVSITVSKLGVKNTTSSLPVSLGTMAPGVTKNATFVFPGSAGTSGATVNLLIQGTYSGGGTFLSNKPVVLP